LTTSTNLSSPSSELASLEECNCSESILFLVFYLGIAADLGDMKQRVIGCGKPKGKY
jgi:hypothetical protein